MKAQTNSQLRDPPQWLKISYTLFVLALIPTYWVLLGPINFLWFSDIALFTTAIALWKKSPLLNSMMFLSVVLFESVWVIDVSFQLITGTTLAGLASYMFDPHESLTVKTFSGIFHIGMPATIVYLMYLWGYDRRALLRQSILACVVLAVTYFCHPEENINWVRGLLGKEGFTLGLSPLAYLITLMFIYPLLIYTPIHFAMIKFAKAAK